MQTKKKNNQIVSRKRVNDFGEVFTAEREVKAMCDLISKDTWENIDATFLEPCCGKGAFIKEILARKLGLCKTIDEGFRAVKSIYTIDIQADNVIDTRALIVDMFVDKFPCYDLLEFDILDNIVRRNVICGDSLTLMKQLQTCEWDELKGVVIV